MDSERIKSAVAKIRYIKDSGDVEFQLADTCHMAHNLMAELTTHFTRAPTFVSAMYQYMVDNGIHITRVEGEAQTAFLRQYGNRISKLTDSQIRSLRKISETMFRNS